MIRILVAGLSESFGGAENIITSIVQNTYQRHDVQYEFLQTGSIKSSYLLRLDKPKVHQISEWGKHPIKYWKGVREILLNKKYDYIWFNTSNASNIILPFTTKKYSSARLIVHSHSSKIDASRRKIVLISLLHYMFKRKFNNLVDVKFACSDKAAKWLFGSSEAVFIVKNGIEVNRYRFNQEIRKDYRERMGLNDKKVVLHVGRMCVAKNHEFIIEIIHELIKIDTRYVLFLVGSGELESQLRKKVEKLKLTKNIKFLGFREDIPGLLNCADVFLLPSLFEGFPITLVEAQTAGLPCVVSDVVTRDVDLSNLVKTLSLKEDKLLWAKQIDRVGINDNRLEYSDIVRQKGFDIEVIAETVINFLLRK